jgi:hypothetical protein
VLGELLEEEVALLNKLLGRRTFSSPELGRKATWRLDRAQWREGFVLAIAAAVKADEEQRPEGPMLRIRAAQALVRLGATERAVPMLEDAVARDWRRDATLSLNNHFLHSAYVSLFDLCFAPQPARARALFWKANDCFGSQGFPWVRPVQDDLAKRFAGTPAWEREAAHVAQLIARR